MLSHNLGILWVLSSLAEGDYVSYCSLVINSLLCSLVYSGIYTGLEIV